MEEITKEAGPPVKKSNRFRRVLDVLIARRNRGKKVPTATPWSRIHERRGVRTLVWGMGDGKTFGAVLLGQEADFSADPSGVTLRTGTGVPVTIGSPDGGEANLLLARKIEKVLRNQGRRAMSLWAGGFALVFLLVLGASGGLGLGRLASLAQTIPGAEGGSPSSLSDLPSSMSSGLTCRTH